MKNVSYTKIFSALIASGLFVFTLTNSSVVFSQASESSGLGEVFKKVQQFELLAAVGDSQTPATPVVALLTRSQVEAKYNALVAAGKSGRALLESFLNTTEGKAQQALFLEIAEEKMPGQDDLIGEVAFKSGFDNALVAEKTGYVPDTAAGDPNQQQQQQQQTGDGNGAGAGGGAPSSPTNIS